MKTILRSLLSFLAGAAAAAVAVAAVFIGGYYYVEPSLPATEELRNVRFQIPLRVYSRDGRLIEQFGEQKRTPVDYEDIPDLLINALLAAEDDRFFQHPGLDVPAIVKAAVNYVIAGGERVPGGSTITQQVARHYFLSRDLSLVRKFKEWILAIRIETEFEKEEILELFFNTFFFGQHSYGIAEAALTYFGKTLDELTLSDVAILAGIPQAPSYHNPIYSTENATNRRAYVLRRMRELRFIDEREYQEALNVPVVGERHGLKKELDAPYVAEMVRAEMVRRFGDAAYTEGFKVTTTLDSRLQPAAQAAVRAGAIEYDERHGYRGPVARLLLPEDVPAEEAVAALEEQALREALADYSSVAGYELAVVLSADETEGRVFLPSRGIETVPLAAVEWAAPYIDDNRRGATPQVVSDVLEAGDIVRFRRAEDGSLRLAQLPEVQSAFVSLDPRDGAIVALSGGFDYFLDKYNRAVQASRQPGSSFKPFIYSAALENGYTLASTVYDTPIAIEDNEAETLWVPENYTSRVYGPVPLRQALIQSLNLATIRVILDAGVLNTVRHLQRFGFDSTALPADATLALGSGGVSPLDLAAGYAVFANGGHRVQPYFIDRVEDAAGAPLFIARPPVACNACDELAPELSDEESLASIRDVTELYGPGRRAPRAITPQNAYLMADAMRDVIFAPGGTGARANRGLDRSDIAGKTGTTNDSRDTWFAGFHRDIVSVAWVGFNTHRPLGSGEVGGTTAIPIWRAFMKEALEGVPTGWVDEPPGIIRARINPENGLRANSCNRNAVLEKFRISHVPDAEPECSTMPLQPRTDAPHAPPTTSSGGRIF